MQVQALFSYTENVIPPRCRKARQIRKNDGVVQIEIPEVTGEEAPVAIRSSGHFMSRQDVSFSVDYRWFNGCLWTADNLDGAEPRRRSCGHDDENWPAWKEEIDVRGEYGNSNHEYGYSDQRSMSKSEIEAAIRELQAKHLIIDGIAHRKAGEPRYVAMTFGLGRNHGGTALVIDAMYNSNLSRSSYFNLLHREEAIALATKFAQERGDDESLPIVPHGPDWEILIPKAIQVKSGDPEKDDTAGGGTSTELEKAEALGFASIEAMYDHAKWLSIHGTQEYHAWAVNITRQTAQ